MYDISDCELRLEYNINIANHTNTYRVWYSNKFYANIHTASSKCYPLLYSVF